jgi:hypothetical protein
MQRRKFIGGTALWALAGSCLPGKPAQLSGLTPSQNLPTSAPESRLGFETSDAKYQATYSGALDVLARNVTRVASYDSPVLIEGSVYGGIWLECAPQEGLVYSLIGPEVARNNHLAFLIRQRDDGQIPCWIRTSAIGWGQIQMVVPIAATAWELAQQTGDSELLEKAYASGGRWDHWLRRFRDTRHTGLCEGFCTWDTGHDNSPRWAGMPNRCPDGDARKCAPLPTLPRLCPDLSASVYGGRMALAAMARALGKSAEADGWLGDAETIRAAIIGKLYSPEDAAFYDVDAQNHFVRVRGDVITRVLGEHVADEKLFATIYARQIRSPDAFWAPYPLPSIALNDAAFVRPIPRNSWAGASQALTALRAPRWLEHYGKPADLAYLMQRWVAAILREGKFLQQLDPLTGAFTLDAEGYSPAGLVFVDFTWRLAGVRQSGDGLEWNVRPPTREVRAQYRLRLKDNRIAEIRYENGNAQIVLNDKVLWQTSDTVRLRTDMRGRLVRAVGINATKNNVVLRQAPNAARKFSLEPNETKPLHW